MVDGNVYRVLARHFGIETPVGTTAAKKEFTTVAQKLLPADSAAFNQGMMDFGALQCTPANPDCLTCPLQASCNAFRTGRVGILPMKMPAAAVQERHFSYIYVRFHGQTAIRKRGEKDIWKGLWEPLVIEGTEVCSAPTLLRSGVKHQLTHRTLIVDFYMWEPSERPQLPEGYIWIQEAELDRYAKPRLFELLLDSV